jgi:hypothetical protein
MSRKNSLLSLTSAVVPRAQLAGDGSLSEGDSVEQLAAVPQMGEQMVAGKGLDAAFDREVPVGRQLAGGAGADRLVGAPVDRVKVEVMVDRDLWQQAEGLARSGGKSLGVWLTGWLRCWLADSVAVPADWRPTDAVLVRTGVRVDAEVWRAVRAQAMVQRVRLPALFDYVLRFAVNWRDADV